VPLPDAPSSTAPNPSSSIRAGCQRCVPRVNDPCRWSSRIACDGARA
jgi:hypothetical protein